MPPGPEREREVERLYEHFEALAHGLEPAVDALRALIASHEPVELISSVAIPASMRALGDGPNPDDATATHTWPAKVEYLVGLALSMPPGSGHTPTDVTDRVVDLLGDVFDAAHAKHMVDARSRGRTGNDDLDGALFLLRLEHLLDRMPGYPTHIEQIDAEIFDPHRALYVSSLGFNPADVSRVVRRRNAALQERVDRARRRMTRLFDRDPEEAWIALDEILQALTDSRTWDPDSVAADAAIDASEIASMLSFFATSFGAQPDFRLPTDENLARTHPCIDLDTGAYFVPDPWSLPAAVHGRMARLGNEPGSSLRQYRKHREQGHQRLVGTALRAVFGDLVAENQHYTSTVSGSGEVDALVLGEWPLIVEAKAHGLTEAGRRGAPRRVARVAADVVEKALEQTTRAREYILDEGGRTFSVNEDKQIDLLPPQLTGATQIIVTFERMDPLAMHGPGAVDRHGRAVWIVNVADLLMVVDVLDDAGSLHHYARTRAATSVAGPIIYMESDALGAYLADRLAAARAEAEEDPDRAVMLGYSSDEINQYFTSTEVGMTVDRPTTGVPPQVAEALRATMGTAPGLWTRVVDAVMAADPGTWKRWRSFSRRHRKGGVFALADDIELSVSPSPSLAWPEDYCIRLSVPAHKSR